MSDSEVKEMLAYANLISKEISDMERALKELRAKISKICKHSKTTFSSDPSGNNDSGYTCDICGKDL